MKWFFAIGFGASAIYTIAAAFGVRWRGHRFKKTAHTVIATIAKPLCGDEPHLEENLRTFTQQDYPNYEVIFGVRDPNDPAAGIARQFGQVVVAEHDLGTNRKVSSLAAMHPHMHGEIIVISDSDMRVTPEYLSAIAAEFENDKVGAVTCLYRATCHPERNEGPGRAGGAHIAASECRPHTQVPRYARDDKGLWSHLAAMWINESFLPSALIANKLQPLRYCFGATMAVRRSVLDEIGGFEALANQLADDYMLGKLVSDRGYRVVLAPYLVDNVVHEPTLRDLFAHELRWARTIRSVRPWSYASTIFTMPLFWGCGLGWQGVAAALVLRVILQAAAPGRFAPWLIPPRDILTISVYGTAHLGRSVRWRQQKFNVSPGGELHEFRAQNAE